MPDLLKTPLYSRHIALGAKMVPFALYSMPVSYTGLLEEAKSTRSHGGLFDVSHMGQIWVRGKHALAELQNLTTNDISRLEIGQAQYNLLCNEKGGVIDDIIVYRRMESDYFICVNASNRKIDWDWLRVHITKSQLSDESDDTALIAIQGPIAEKLVKRLGAGTSLKYYTACEAKISGKPIYLSRTGYTGEDGFEIYIDNSDAGWLWDTLLEMGRPEGLVHAGLGARDTLRTEMGYPLYGHELSETITPIEAGLKWVVKTNKEFIGKDVLESQIANGAPRILRGFEMADRRMARPGYPIFSDKKEVGIITSGTFSPHKNAPIALGFVQSRFATASHLDIQIRDQTTQGKIVPLPFLKSKVRN